MKRTLGALLAICAMAIPAGAQEMSVSYNKATMEQVLTDLKKKTNYTFVYQKSVIANCPAVTLSNQSAPLFTLLQKVLQGTGLEYEVVDNTIVIRKAQPASNERRTITGQVTDENGEALWGVSIQQLGTTQGTTTDSKGQFSMQITGKSPVLKFTYVGMQTREVVVTEKSGRILMVRLNALTQTLDDVVVTGYQTISKERATGSFDKVSSAVLDSRPSADLSSMLQGVVAGMQSSENEDGSVDFLIRGTSSLYAGSSPLIVVDGFPIEGTFNSINPNDVESVTVLKDAAAASIWGARSANGVIVVTTKKGQKGKLKVNVQGFYRLGTTPDLDYILSTADSKTTVDYEMMALENGWYLSEFSASGSNIATPLSMAQEYYYANQYYGMSDAEMNANLDRLRTLDNRQQIKDYLMQTQALQQYNASISGGTDKYSTYASLMYEKNDEATVKRGYERYLVNFNNSYKFNSRITGTLSATFQHKEQETSGPSISSFANLSPYEMLLNEDGSYAKNIGSWNTLIADNMSLTNLPYNDLSYNLLREVRGREYTTETTRYRVNAGINARIWRKLSFDTKFQYERNDTEVRNYDSEETDYVRQMVNYYVDYDLTNDVLKKQYIPTGGMINSNTNKQESYVWRNQLSYNETLGKHDITALAGLEMSRYKTSYKKNPTVVGYNEKTNTSKAPYFGANESAKTINGYQDYYNTLASLVSSSFSDRVDKYFSYFGNLAYMYDGKYGASFSIRADGSNFVTKDKSLRWSPMWSVGAKWNMQNEKFMGNTHNWLDRLTLRATYGINGNAEKSTSPQTLLNTRYSSTTGTNISAVSSYGNPLLRWEETYTTNVGVDFSVFKGMLSGKVEYYNRLGKYIVGTVTIPSVYGSTTQRYNNAEILNRGFEVELTGRGTVKDIGLGIASTVTFSYNKNEVKKLFYPDLYCYQLADDGTFVEGKPIGAIYSYEFGGTIDGVPHVKDQAGNLYSFNDLTLHNRTLGLDKMTYSGTTISPASFGWANQFTWKGLELYVYMTGNLGGVFRAPTCDYIPIANGKMGSIPTFINKLMESDGTNYPSLPAKGDWYCYRWSRYLPNLQSDIEDASFIRLKEINLAYHLPKAWMSKIHVAGAKVFVQARDLGLIYAANQYGYDPEWLPGNYKPSASITFGASLNF